jgi:hypothetical protein
MRRCLWSEQKSPMSFCLLPTCGYRPNLLSPSFARSPIWQMSLSRAILRRRCLYGLAEYCCCALSTWQLPLCRLYSASSLSTALAEYYLLCRLLGSCRRLVPFCVVVVYTAWPNTVAVSLIWQLSLSRPILRSRCIYGLTEYCCCCVVYLAAVVVSSHSASSSRLARALTTRNVSLGAWTKTFYLARFKR